ncbi:unnamed protein product, partial [Schistosoma curassoni]|uniref:TROVE domain-containing protein n=1 Tax=Schistosoma curassoni TaxID=6186 RepID=A0A183L1R2_9TREM
MDHESGHLKVPFSLLSPVYLEGKNLVKNKLLDEPFTKTSSVSNTLSSLSLNNKSLKSSISLSYTGSVLHCDHEVTVRPNDKHHEEKKTSVPSSLKSTPIDWLNDAIIEISDTSFQNILECTVDDSMKSNSIHNTFGNLLTYERRDTYKQLKLELISCISSSIVDGSPSKEKKIVLGQSIHSCIDKDPEFILKAALYCRRELNIRTTTNILIAVASCNERSRSFIKKYFSSCIRTPSDWIEVAEYYAVSSKNVIISLKMISGNPSLKGDWDSSKAGTCMKFPIPVTWETELSVNGNNSDSWSKLITLNKVPHMAMLRNLRNILKSDIQDGIHEIVLKRLTDP